MSKPPLVYPTRVVTSDGVELRVKRIIIMGEFDNFWQAYVEEVYVDPVTGNQMIDCVRNAIVTTWRIRPVLMVAICPLAQVITVGEELTAMETQQNAKRLLDSIGPTDPPPNTEGPRKRHFGHRLWSRFRSYLRRDSAGHR
jgi:hypothetical protein